MNMRAEGKIACSIWKGWKICMTVKEFYTAIGASYDEAMSRLMNDDFAKRMLSRFPADQSYAKLAASMEGTDTDDAFTQAHTLKGLCANLSLGRLSDRVAAITELLRGGDMDAARAMMPEVTEAYEETLKLLQEVE